MLDKYITFGGDVIPAWIASAPKLVRPKRKMKSVQIPGSNREVVEMEDAYEPYDQPYTLFIGDGTENSIQAILDDVAQKLYKTGWQVLTDDYDSETYRLACYAGSFDVENRDTRAGKFEVSFHCRPERFLVAGNVEVDVVNGDTLTNPTGNPAKPLIHIEGSGSGTLTVAGVMMSFTNIGDYLNIDCETEDVYRLPAENRNNRMTGDFPVLKPGNNHVSFTGGITAVKITPKYWRV